MQQTKRGQQHKQGYQADLNKYFGKRLRIKLNGRRTIMGQVAGYDIFMNLVLENAKEVITFNQAGTQAQIENYVDIGYTIVRGNSIIMWECLDKVRDI